jgi:hypothetical protein
MSSSPLGHGARPASARPKNRPIPPGLPAHALDRPVLHLPTRRPRGVGAPTTAPRAAVAAPALPGLREAVALSLRTLEDLQRRTRDVAACFRWNKVREANHGLGELVQTTQTLLRLAVVAAQAAGADLRHLCAAGGSHVDEDTLSAVDLLIAKQLASDWIAVADTLDRAFAPALSEWRGVFESLAATAGNDDPDDLGGHAA